MEVAFKVLNNNSLCSTPGKLTIGLKTHLQSVVDALDAVTLHANQETTGQLRARSPSVEEGRRCMGEPALRQQMVCGNCSLNILLVDSDGDSHQHVLGALNNSTIHLQKV